MLEGNRHMLDYISKFAGNKNYILDAGCGTGNLLIRLAKDNDVVGIDFSKKMVERAREKTSSYTNVLVKEGDVTKTDFKDCSFDVVISVNVLQNLPNPISAVKESHRILKHNGLFIACCPHAGIKLDNELISRIKREIKESGGDLNKATKLFSYNKKMISNGGMKFLPSFEEIGKIFMGHGFKIVLLEKIYYDCNILIAGKKI